MLLFKLKHLHQLSTMGKGRDMPQWSQTMCFYGWLYTQTHNTQLWLKATSSCLLQKCKSDRLTEIKLCMARLTDSIIIIYHSLYLAVVQTNTFPDSWRLVIVSIRLMCGLIERLSSSISCSSPSSVQFYELRLMFLMTALQPELRTQLQQVT